MICRPEQLCCAPWLNESTAGCLCTSLQIKNVGHKHCHCNEGNAFLAGTCKRYKVCIPVQFCTAVNDAVLVAFKTRSHTVFICHTISGLKFWLYYKVVNLPGCWLLWMKSAPIFFLKWLSCFCHCSSIKKHTKRTCWSCNNFFWQNRKCR